MKVLNNLKNLINDVKDYNTTVQTAKEEFGDKHPLLMICGAIACVVANDYITSCVIDNMVKKMNEQNIRKVETYMNDDSEPAFKYKRNI